VLCPSCGHENPDDSRFCNSCGQPLSAEAQPGPDVPEHLAEKIRAGRSALEGERKLVTVLFADVMGSMELAEQTDAETWRGIMDRFFAILSEGVHRFEGTVDKFTGDGIMALFGAPIAHEDHARRACIAALHLAGSLTEYAAELRRSPGINFSVRIGLNSGEVVVGTIGDDLGMSYTAVGHTVGLAQRMEQLAEPGKAYVTEYTAGLAEGYVEMSDLGEFEVKGSSRPLHVHELTGFGAGRGRLDVSRARGFSRFVGREKELAVLEQALESASGGEGKVVGIVGEPGVGKSRLCHEFAERCRARGVPVYEAQAQAHGKAVPLLPVLQLVRAYFGIRTEDDDRRAREKVAGRLLLLDPGFAEDLPLLFDFLAIPDPERPPPQMNAEARQRQLLDITRRLLHTGSQHEQGVNLLEDLHWIDPGSKVYLDNLVQAVEGSRTLSVLNYRPEFESEWMDQEHFVSVELVPLGSEAIEELLDDLLGPDPSLVPIRELVRERTSGNPFFIEEVIQSLLEAGNLEGDRGALRLAHEVDETAVPASVQAVLAARIDRLDERDKALLQEASVIGKEFSRGVLCAISPLRDGEIDEALANLVGGDFVYEQARRPEAIYAFKHPLTQEVAYGSLLADRRGGLHAAVAEAIADLHPERADENAALIAQHWEQAGDDRQASRWHARAAAWTGTNDPSASLAHWRRVRELADMLPEDAETAALGITSRIWMLQFGWRLSMAMEEADQLFTEADELAQRQSDMRSRASLLTVYASVRGLASAITVEEYASAALEAIALAEESGDKALYTGISIASCFALMNAGRYREGMKICERSIEYGSDDPTIGTGISVKCPYAWCVMWKGVLLTYLGDLAEAEHWIERGMEIARAQGDMETVGWCYQMKVWLGFNRGPSKSMLADGQRQLEIAEQIGDSFSRTWSHYWLGLAHRAEEDWDRAIELAERAEAMSQELGTAVLGRAPRLVMLAECYLEKGDGARALELAREAVAEMERQCQRSVEGYACNVLARVLSRTAGKGAREEIDELLDRAQRSAEATEFESGRAWTLRERAEIAGRFGDREAYESGMREAVEVWEQIKATGFVEQVSQELQPQPG
jgi:class 3 adenylate cyclase/tetratricopeptide (TPR) repeat protein